MRGLRPEERAWLEHLSNGDCSKPGLHELTDDEWALQAPLELRGLAVRLPCLNPACGFTRHTHITLAGKLALQCDALARTTVEV